MAAFNTPRIATTTTVRSIHTMSLIFAAAASF